MLNRLKTINSERERDVERVLQRRELLAKVCLCFCFADIIIFILSLFYLGIFDSIMNDDADSFSLLFLGGIHEKETAMVEV